MAVDDRSGAPPQMNPANLALRFGLELASIAGLGVVAARITTLASIAAVAGAIVVWVVFATPDDPSRSGNAPVATAGPIRLALELAILVGGALGWFIVGRPIVGVVLVILIVAHHLAARPRLRWLVAQRR